MIRSFFTESIEELKGCPTLLRTDRGIENGFVATIQFFLRWNNLQTRKHAVMVHHIPTYELRGGGHSSENLGVYDG